MQQKKSSDAGQMKVLRERFKVCPACGNFCGYAEGQTFCVVCGVRLLLECPSCREPILYPTAKFCPVCGMQLVNGQGESYGKGETSVSPKTHP
jgi:hypothetical protein